MASRILGQGTFFYELNWTPEIDSLLLSTILRMKNTCKVDGSVIPIRFFKQAAADIYEHVGLRFPWGELYDRFQFFEQRYLAFKEVVATNGVFWDVNTNTITAPEPVWKALVKKNSLAESYYYNGEPEFHKLSMLFNPKVVKVETETEVIVADTTKPLDDGHYGKSLQGDNIGMDSEASESVSSPVVAAGPKMRRKLFVEDAPNVDSSSANMPKKHYYGLGHEGELIRKLENVYPRNQVEPRFNPTASPHGSSCGSSSPAKWLKNPFP